MDLLKSQEALLSGVLRSKDVADATIAVKDAAIAAKDAAKDAAREKASELALKVVALQSELQSANAAALRSKGLLSMRGIMGAGSVLISIIVWLDCACIDVPVCAESVETRARMEYADDYKELEAQYRRLGSAQAAILKKDAGSNARATHATARRIAWQVLLDKKVGLEDCIRDCTGWTDIPGKMESLYTSLSNRVHLHLGQRSDDRVDIVASVLSDKECLALQCVCDIFVVRYRTTNEILPDDLEQM